MSMKQPSDIEGVFSAVQAGVAIAGGGRVAELKRQGVQSSCAWR
jgi:hypothetical protein